MKRFSILILSCLLMASFGMARNMVYKVGAFDQITVDGNIRVVYRSVPDSAGKAIYRSGTDYSRAIEINCKGGKLSIKEKSGHDLGPIPTIYVYSDFLTKITNKNNAFLRAELSTRTPTLSINLYGDGEVECSGLDLSKVSASLYAGSGRILLEGSSEEADFSILGSGEINTTGLEARTVKCNCIGKGEIKCAPIDLLDVKGVGKTKIYYIGNPKVKKIGLASINRMGEIEDEPESGGIKATAEEEYEPTVVTEDD